MDLVKRFVIWIVVLILFIAGVNWMQEAFWPTVTNNLAVNQLRDSDAAFVELRSAEQIKELVSVAEVLVLLLWSVMVWYRPIKRQVAKFSKECPVYVDQRQNRRQ